MTTKEFWKNYDLSGEVNIHESTNKYNESDMNIHYVRLDRPIDGQDYLVLSEHAATALMAGTTPFAEMQVTKGDTGKWGIIMPDSSKIVKTIKLF